MKPLRLMTLAILALGALLTTGSLDKRMIGVVFARYGLPHDYPMVAQDYREHRSGMAKAIGLGVPPDRR